jgi:hypothetical protein
MEPVTLGTPAGAAMGVDRRATWFALKGIYSGAVLAGVFGAVLLLVADEAAEDTVLGATPSCAALFDTVDDSCAEPVFASAVASTSAGRVAGDVVDDKTVPDAPFAAVTALFASEMMSDGRRGVTWLGAGINGAGVGTAGLDACVWPGFV